MLDFYQNPQYVENPEDTTQHLENALRLLLGILKTQIDRMVPASTVIRAGSTSAWYQDAANHETAYSNYNPHHDCPNHPVDQDHETFPEQFSARQGLNTFGRTNEKLRNSRYALLKRLRATLYQAQDDGNSVQEGFRTMWSFLIYAMGSNHYLREWCNGVEIAQAWDALARKDRKAFTAKYFGLDQSAMDIWQQAHASATVQDHQVWQAEEYADFLRQERSDIDKSAMYGRLGAEVRLLLETIQDFSFCFPYYPIEVGFKDECTDISQWASKVTDHADLSDDAECPICFLGYQLEEEIPMGAEPPHPTPVKMPCKHIVCLPCLDNWAASNSENHTKCPMCREELPPPNAHVQNVDKLLDDVSGFYSPQNLTPQESAELSLDSINTYLTTLPKSIRDTTPPPLAIEAYNLYCWRYNVLDSRAAQVGTKVLLCNTPMASKDSHALAKAALHCLHLARDRLEAFCKSDQEQYRTARISALHARANFENLLFVNEVQAWAEQYWEWLEEEEDEENDDDDDAAGSDSDEEVLPGLSGEHVLEELEERLE